MQKPAPRRIIAIDLFCGVGGLTQGLGRAGIDVVMGVDLDPACQYAFEANNAATFVNADVMQLRAEELAVTFADAKGVSLLAGCAPCQPFSTYSRSAKRGRGDAAKSHGSEDWALLRRFGELISDLKPDLVTMENVPPLRDQQVFREFVDGLGGYYVDYEVVDGRMVGLPQTRKRLVLVGSTIGPISLSAPHGIPNTVRATIGSLPSLNAGDVDPCDALHTASRLSALNVERIRASKPGGTWRDWPKRLRARCHTRASGATYPSVYGRMAWDAPSPTITTQCFGYGNGRFGHPEADRAISLREAAMLQGFSHDYRFLRPQERASFATMGRLIGNAVPVPLGEYIGRALVEHVSQADANQRRTSCAELRPAEPAGSEAR